ncbi:acyltransferase family protein [Alteraurantiacibacter buctensis]|uniref:Acyltransferase family protein n=1 Tax=Alteraurantiacibacter buctensis TaxID=1503981 RepID=A0A844YSA8_9SPHN|nr:acyltransferase [Alteraurantiacibacter buctensis]MXO70439.1 acyltransferase family protein [Alteraurantiacibacter buctensis]
MKRLECLDALRGIAALLVVLQHVLEQAVPHFVLLQWCNIGRLGVFLFFLISGFVVPFSIRGDRPLRRFAISRAARLLPALWLSIAVMLAFASATPGVVLANMAMIARPLGLPELAGVYWTLTYELAFYLVVAGLFTCGLLRNARVVGLATLVLLAGVVPAVPTGYAGMLLNFSLLLTGLLLRLALLEQDPRARPWAVAATVALLAAGSGYALLFDGGNPRIDGLPRLTATLLAVPIFLATVLRQPAAGRVPVFLGTISYSVYLFQEPVLRALHGLLAIDATLYVLAVPAATIAVASAVYFWVERPFIALGQRRTATRPLPA